MAKLWKRIEGIGNFGNFDFEDFEEIVGAIGSEASNQIAIAGQIGRWPGHFANPTNLSGIFS